MYKCKPSHPTHRKIDKLMVYAEELEISISFEGSNTVVKDKDYPYINYYLRDIEADSFTGNVMDIPYNYQYELFFDGE